MSFSDHLDQWITDSLVQTNRPLKFLSIISYGNTASKHPIDCLEQVNQLDLFEQYFGMKCNDEILL